MTKRYCDTGRIDCPHLPQCAVDCAYDTIEMGRETRKVKAYPEVPKDIEPVAEVCVEVGAPMIVAAVSVLVLIIVLIFFIGFFIGSL